MYDPSMAGSNSIFQMYEGENAVFAQLAWQEAH